VKDFLSGRRIKKTELDSKLKGREDN
jgi:hypothetical protein